MLTLAACSQDVPEIPQTELYTREWVKTFGVVDDTQDWNNATRAGVQVSCSKPTRVTVTTIISGHNYLLADYADVQGTHTLNFDIPRGINDITVHAGTQAVRTTVGGKVSFDSSGRAIWDDNDSNDNVVTISRKPIIELEDSTVVAFGRFLPEQKDNRGKVTQNFSFVSQGKFTLFPIFFNTSNTNTLAIYYLKNEGTDDECMAIVPFHTIKVRADYEEHFNLQWLPENALTPGLESFWAEQREGSNGYTIESKDAINWNDSEKNSFSDFSKEELDEFKIKFISLYSNTYYLENSLKEYFNIDPVLSYTNSSGNLPDEIKERAILTDIEYTVNNDSGDLTIHRIFINGFDDIVDESMWHTPGNNEYYMENCSHPRFEAYKKYNDQGFDYQTIRDILSGTANALPLKWRVEPIEVDIKVGTRFGICMLESSESGGSNHPPVVELPMVMKEELGYKCPQRTEDDKSGHLFFSQARYNTDKMTNKDGQRVNAVHAATYTYTLGNGKTYQALGFEDWYDGPENEWDLNDVIYFVDVQQSNFVTTNEDEPEPEDPKPIRWLIACEDLGASDDFDFNDVVFEVEYVAGQDEARIYPLAAGGTLPTYLCCKNLADGDGKVDEREWHYLFEGDHDYREMINTGNGPAANHKGAITIKVDPEKFTIAASEISAEGDYSQNMGGFYLQVEREDRTITDITAPSTGEAPQMILIFQPADRKWQWPRERRNIEDAYPGFKTWRNPDTGFDFEVSDGETELRSWFDTSNGSYTYGRTF